MNSVATIATIINPERAVESAVPYVDGMDCVRDLLRCLDDRLTEAVCRLQASAPVTSEPILRGLVITGTEAKQLLESLNSMDRSHSGTFAGSIWSHAEKRMIASHAAGIALPLNLVRDRLGLEPFELECLLVCLAVEVDLKYEKIFAYLNDDVTRKHPTVALLLDLLCPAERHVLFHRRYLMANSHLFKAGILECVDDGRSTPLPSSLSRSVRLESGVVRFLLDKAGPDPELEDFPLTFPTALRAEELWSTSESYKRAVALMNSHLGQSQQINDRMVFTLVDGTGSGLAYAARRVCASRGMGLLAIDCARVARSEHPVEFLIHAFRDSRLGRAALLLGNLDTVALDHERGKEFRSTLDRLMDELGWLVFVLVTDAALMAGWFGMYRNVVIEETVCSGAERLEQWLRLFSTQRPPLKAKNLEELAEALSTKFRLNPGQIAEAFQRTVSSFLPHFGAEEEWNLFHKHAGLVSAPRLKEYAQRIEPMYRWHDIVLPEHKLELLHDIVRRMRYRRTVMEDWHFGAALSRGRGLNVLFFGPSGTGKTMAAEIIAHELKMELYRIDLASVVSKYIGETEKNLSCIFREAERSNAILFFDEADALFGKRSEVKDAHDRYANIEIGYLLQRMDEYDGIVILATNLRNNLDEAFSRRMQATIEFPFPDEEYRRRIYEGIFPKEAPLSSDIDFAFLARQFKVTGSNIKNIALHAAFLAAEDGKVISMAQLIRATKQELQKMGRLCSKADFGPYYELIKESVRTS